MTSKLKVNLINDAGDNNLITSDGSGSVTLGTAFPAVGKIGQVVSTTKTDTFSMTSTTFTDITGLSLSITPSSTSSKILVLSTINYNGLGGERCYFRLVGGTNNLSIGDAAGSRPRVTTGGVQTQSTYSSNESSIMHLDSPSTTSAITFKIQMRGLSADAAIYVNRTQADRDTANYEPRLTSSITVMEVLP